jgi:hypothetical protein
MKQSLSTMKRRQMIKLPLNREIMAQSLENINMNSVSKMVSPHRNTILSRSTMIQSGTPSEVEALMRVLREELETLTPLLAT